MEILRELFQPEPLNRITIALILGLFVSRTLDFLSTWLATPRLSLEANPLMRRIGYFRMALLNLPLLGLPLLHNGLAITFIVTSLLAAGANLASAALAKGMGESNQLASQQRAIRNLGVARALAFNSAGGLVTMLAGLLLMVMAPWESHGWWGGLGVLMYGVVGLVHFNMAIIRLGLRKHP